MAIVRFHLQLQTTSLEVCKGFNLVKQNETNHVIRLCKRARLVELAFIINFGHVIYVSQRQGLHCACELNDVCLIYLRSENGMW